MPKFGTKIRSLGAALAGLLLTLVAWSQDAGVVRGVSADIAAATIEVKGILISPRSQSALINGQILRVGDTVAGAEIVAIDQREVRLRAGTRETGVPVGALRPMSALNWLPVTPMIDDTIDDTAVLQAAVSAASPAEPESELATDLPQRHAVSPGETLSEIAEAYLVPGVRRYQLMVALFEANPHAFRGNINLMRAGVELDIPDVDALVKTPAKTAMAKVMEQTDRWRSERPLQPVEAPAEVAGTYGPVSSGETLSLIAHRLSNNSHEAQGLMSALYRANPHAFGDSIHMLREGAVLQIPQPLENDMLPPDTVVAHAPPF